MPRAATTRAKKKGRGPKSAGMSRRMTQKTVKKATREIASRKRGAAFDRLREELALNYLASIVESSQDAVIGKDMEGTIQSWNTGAQMLYGYTPAEAIGQNISMLMPTDHPDEFPSIMEKLRRGERITHYETTRVRKDGSVVQVSLSISPIRAADGTIVGASAIARDITERLEIERRLQQSEERYRAFIRHSTEAIWCYEGPYPIPISLPEDEQIALFFREAYLSECNDAMARMYGFTSAEELRGTKLSEFLLESDPKNVEGLRMFIRSGYQLTDVESHEVDKDGNDKYFLNNQIGIVRDGMLVRAWGTQRDITESKRAGEELRVSEERLRLAADAGQVGLWDWDIASNRVTWSQRIYQHHGLEPGAFGGTVEEFANLIHPDDRQRVQQAIAGAMEGKPYQLEFRPLHPSGEIRWLWTSARVLFDADGKPMRMLGATIDITERKRAQEEVRQLNAELEQKVEERTRELKLAQERDRANLRRLKEIMAHLPVAAIALDENGRILEVNEVFTRAFDFSRPPEQLAGLSSQEVVQEFLRWVENPAEHLEELRVIFTQRLPQYGSEIRLNDGRVFLRDSVPIFENGEFRGQFFLFRDVTRERRIDASKSEFMSLASHQLRTPLTNIRWTFGRLGRSLGERASEDEKRLVSEGKSAALRMADTIDTMLSISRIESGESEPRKLDVGLCELLHEVGVAHRVEFARMRQAFEISCSDDVQLRTDPHFLKEVIHNLLANACKYTPEGGSIRLSGGRDENGGVWVEVRDDGYGIPRHQQDQIFRKFFRGENVVGKVTEGSGLGLYLVSLIVTLLGGSIAVSSEEGKGTTFRVTLPQ